MEQARDTFILDFGIELNINHKHSRRRAGVNPVIQSISNPSLPGHFYVMQTNKKQNPATSSKREMRTLRIMSRTRYNVGPNNTAPLIYLYGDWLRNSGFTCGQKVTVMSAIDKISRSGKDLDF
jgi:hypothetical protein